ncbi:flagellin [Alphaproteobacteria bacterium LSUCC0226]
MTVINTNVGALMARTYASKAAQKTETSMERLSSGLRINGAADDAAGMAVANKMQSQLKGIKMAIRNSQDGISLVQTAESGMGEISNMILRMRELAVQMENGIYTSKDRDNAQLEVNALLAEVDKIAVNTKFNGVDLLDGAYDQTIRAGNTNAETIRVSIDGLKTADTAKLTQYAVEKAVSSTAATYSSNATTLALTAKATGKVEIDLVSLAHASFKEVFKGDSLGTFELNSGAATAARLDNGLFTIDAKTGKLTSSAAVTTASDSNTDSNHQIAVKYTPRGTSPTVETFLITLDITAPTASTLSGIKVETSALASHAVETLDKALEEVSSAQAKLGAIQNRLQHNIDNLSKGAMLTEQSVGRVVDADFATETSNLSKQQILNQAATAMLAQANQSKQSVLSLLQ